MARRVDVTLRPAREADAVVLASWERDDRFCRQAGWRAHASVEEAVRWWRERLLDPHPAALRLLGEHEGEVVGYVDLAGAGGRERELGYVVGPSARWGRGLGAAIARAGADHGFTVLRLDRIRAEADAAATASLRILRGLGMREVGPTGAAASAVTPRRFVLDRASWAAAERTRHRYCG